MRFLLLSICLSTSVFAQSNFSAGQVITTNAMFTTDVFLSDLDSDGDADVLSASYGDDKIAWYENQGNGNFGPQEVISTSGDNPAAVFAADLDGDGDQEVLAVSQSDDKVVWYENLTATIFCTTTCLNIFGPEQIISTATNSPSDVCAEDLDGDGDLDVIVASYSDDRISWFENLGGGNFGSGFVITNQADGARSVFTADIDCDGDMDVVAASQNDGKIAWHENLGNGAFGTEHVVMLYSVGARSVHVADLDQDGDLDIVAASQIADTVAWFENLNCGTFGPQRILSSTSNGAWSVHAGDLDYDGDTDVVAAAYGDDTISMFRNLGGGLFAPGQAITSNANGARSVVVGDMNSDCQLDILWGAYWANTVAWHQNQPLGTASPLTWSYNVTLDSNQNLTLSMVDGYPGWTYYMFHSNHLANGVFTGAGMIFGLHITLGEVMAQSAAALQGNPLHSGVLNLNGANALTIPASQLTALSGQTWWSVAVRPSGPCQPGNIFEGSPIRSVVFP